MEVPSTMDEDKRKPIKFYKRTINGSFGIRRLLFIICHPSLEVTSYQATDFRRLK